MGDVDEGLDVLPVDEVGEIGVCFESGEVLHSQTGILLHQLFQQVPQLLVLHLSQLFLTDTLYDILFQLFILLRVPKSSPPHHQLVHHHS